MACLAALERPFLFAFIAMLTPGASPYASTFSFEQIVTLDEMID